MKKVGIICEYNPLHRGHQKQINLIRERFGPDTAVCCLMSGNYVQRGAPAIVDKSIRAKAAILAGADLVLELPVTYALSSAEGFAAGGVRILSSFCDALCFGTETGDIESLLRAARLLLSGEFPPLLRQQLEKGLSFPAARQAALECLHPGSPPLILPNDILAVEYCKAILSQDSPLEPFPIRREGSYHAPLPDRENPSASSLRSLMLQSEAWLDYLPEAVRDCFRAAPLHTLDTGERAILYRLRAMSDAEYEALPYGSEGLWRKLMRAAREEATLEAVVSAVKSKRYTRTRIDRMVMCAFLGITREILEAPVPYTRALAFNETGRSVLKTAKKKGTFRNAGERTDHPYWTLEKRCGDLYGLFCQEAPEPPGAEEKRRIHMVSCPETGSKGEAPRK